MKSFEETFAYLYPEFFKPAVQHNSFETLFADFFHARSEMGFGAPFPSIPEQAQSLRGEFRRDDMIKKLSRKERREHDPFGIAFKRAACKFLKIRMPNAPRNAVLRERCIVALDLKPDQSGLIWQGYEDILKLITMKTEPWDPVPFDADHNRSALPRIEEPSVSQADINAFYDSWEWKRCRYDFIKDKKRLCACCAASAATGVRIVVDHIKPIRRFWRLRLDPSNLQILCDDCNKGKGSRDYTDWRVA